ncbi:MAG: hypothetical protein M0Z83_07255 [Betaproteobacteria bacterium]|nr:hypothetical protein [Betaproteobacteria bacterium]
MRKKIGLNVMGSGLGVGTGGGFAQLEWVVKSVAYSTRGAEMLFPAKQA